MNASLLYFFWISLTISLGLVWSVYRAKKYNFPSELFFSITGWLLIVIPAGARLLHIFFESPHYYLEQPIRTLQIWNGGFVYYGGLIAGVVFSILYFRLQKRSQSFHQTADFLTPVLCMGTGLGRIACFLQGCCFGAPTEFIIQIQGRHPTQLYMMLSEMLILALLLKKESVWKKQSGRIFWTWIGLSAFGRFLIEFIRDDFRGAFYLGLSISQWVAITMVIISIVLLIALPVKNQQRIKI